MPNFRTWKPWKDCSTSVPTAAFNYTRTVTIALRTDSYFRNQRLDGRALGGAPLPQEAMVSHFAQRIRFSDWTHVLAVSHFHLGEGKRILIRIAYSSDR
jgi:hypothetical protein